MMRFARAARLRPKDDDGAGLLLVIATSGVVMALVLVAGTIANRSLASSRNHDSFAASLSAAESGIDLGLARVQKAFDTNGSDYRTPHPSGTAFDGTPDCVGSEVVFPASAGASNAAETAWARAQLSALANVPGCLRTTPRGEYVMLKPAGRQVVYAMGWSPRRGAVDAKMRMIKSEYIFAPYKPTTAVLTGGDLQLDASTKISGTSTSSNAQAGVHSNGNVSVGGGNPIVTGPVTQAGGGSLPSSTKFETTPTRTSTRSIPNISARSVYTNNVGKPAYATNWWDLCSNGEVRRGATTGPCTGAFEKNVAAGGTFNNGWAYTAGTPGVAPVWRVIDDFVDGIYYASQSDVIVGNVGNPSVSNATVIASSEAMTCDKLGGNIYWKKINIGAPALAGTFMVADQDFKSEANFQAGSKTGTAVVSGLFIAGDQIELQTSSNGAYGSVIAGDQCDPSGSMVDANLIKNPTVYYDPTGYAPFTDVVNTTLWLELTGGG